MCGSEPRPVTAGTPAGIRRLAALLLGWILLAGCRAWIAQDSAQSEDPDSAVVLFQDDFSSHASGWHLLAEPGAKAGYDGNAFLFQIFEPERYYWSTPGLEFRDARLRVLVTKRSGSDIGTFGVICRYRDAENFYFFTITGDGYYAVGKFESGVESLIGLPVMALGPAIMQGNVTNHITVACVGESLSMQVNGAELIRVRDSSFAKGDIGLIAGALSIGDLEVQFENLSITTP